MKAYSQDLRERVLAARQAGATQAAVAAQFSVSISFVAKLTRRQRTAGTVAARPPGRGPAPRLDAPALGHLRDCLRQTPDATLDELRGWLVALGGPAVSRSALGRAVQRLDWRRKKEHPCRRARHRTREGVALGVPRSHSGGRLYGVYVRG